ncbi:TIGR03085 family metal-binding protein [Actinopolymorpha alba]|uniref:TIGR03085 family metal-binding protein n=1 Tax=Actinopolymorpha alba TaxID=533267 RepID=UPI00036B24B4|nr:TIGR03085 family metal-binding protein [Actinopolymorpha alba]
MTDHARAERHAIADLLDAVGPDAPTLCAGWTTSDLVAHLVVREGDLLGAAGILIGPLSRHTRATMDGLIARVGYTGLVDQFRNPPRWSPSRVAALDEAANTMEFFVHHEDVRRAQTDWSPRELPADLEDLLWRRVTRAGRFLFRRAAVGVLVARPDGTTVRVRNGEPTAVVSGQPSEITLYMFGRKAVARVEIGGSDAAVEALAHTPFGV